MKKNPVVHFEMPYDDAARLAKFYEAAFGWGINKLGEEMGNYVLATTTETDENNMVQTPGTINGGFAPRSDGYKAPSVVINVDDINEAMQKVKDAGGEVLNDPVDIPGIGVYVTIHDSEGNQLSMMQPSEGN
jgi:uncharacterized protein